MKSEVERNVPEEACGLLIGEKSFNEVWVRKIIPVTNILHSSTRFRMSGEEQIAAFNQLEKEGLELVGIYHSHPSGPSGPSEVDINEAYYPNVVHLIWSKIAVEWTCRAYQISGKYVSDVMLNSIESL